MCGGAQQHGFRSTVKRLAVRGVPLRLAAVSMQHSPVTFGLVLCRRPCRHHRLLCGIMGTEAPRACDARVRLVERRIEWLHHLGAQLGGEGAVGVCLGAHCLLARAPSMLRARILHRAAERPVGAAAAEAAPLPCGAAAATVAARRRARRVVVATVGLAGDTLAQLLEALCVLLLEGSELVKELTRVGVVRRISATLAQREAVRHRRRPQVGREG